MRSVFTCKPHAMCIFLALVLGGGVLTAAEESLIPLQVQQWQAAAEESLLQKEYEPAIVTFTQIISTYPDTEYALDAKRGIAVAHLKNGNKALADTDLEAMWGYRSQPNFLAAMRTVKNQYWSAGHRDQAQALCRQLIAEFPESPLTGVLQKELVCGHILRRNKEQAGEELEIFWQRHQQKPDFVKLGNAIALMYADNDFSQEALALGKRLLTAFPQHALAPVIVKNMILEKMDVGDTAGASDDIEDLLGRYAGYEKTPEMGLLIANRYHNQFNEYRTALRLFRRLQSLYPDPDRAIQIEAPMIDVYLKMKDKATADRRLAACRATYANHPKLPTALNAIGNAYRRQGYQPEAVALFRTVLQQNPDDNEKLCAYASIAKAHVQLLSTMSDPNGTGIMELSTLLDPNGIATDIYPAVQPDEMADRLVQEYAQADRIGFQIFVIGEEYFLRGQQWCKEGHRQQGYKALQAAIRVWQHNRTQLPDRRHAALAAYYSAVASGYMGDESAALAYYYEVAQDYPEFEKAWHARYMIAQCAEKLAQAGEVSATEAAAVQLAVYQEMLQRDPNCPVAPVIRRQLLTISQ